MFAEIIGQIFCHALGECGGQHPFTNRNAQLDLPEQIIHLGVGRFHDDFRIHQTRRSGNHLYHLLLVFFFVIGWGGRDKHTLTHDALKLFKFERTVVHGRRQAPAIIHQIGLARAVTQIHATHLRHGDMAFVDNHQRMRRQVVDQGRRRITGIATGQMTTVVFNAFAKADFIEHLQIKTCALLDTLCFYQLVLGQKKTHPLAQFLLDGFHGAYGRFARCHIMTGREDTEIMNLVKNLTGQRIEQLDAIDFIIEQTDAYRGFAVLGREYINNIATHPKTAATEIKVVAVILHVDELGDDVFLRDFLALMNMQHHAMVFTRVADTINGGNRSHNHRIFALQYGLGR